MKYGINGGSVAAENQWRRRNNAWQQRSVRRWQRKRNGAGGSRRQRISENG
jgi:hypothetical protein